MRLRRMEELVLQAGAMLPAASDHFAVHCKEGFGNYVTDCDIAVQNFLERELLDLVPEASFLGEELDAAADAQSGWCFVVDPIDGTTNFMRDLSMSAVCVALACGGQVQAAFVYQPYLKQMYRAVRGEGAFLNGRPIHAAGRPLAKSIVQMGLAGHLRGQATERAFAIQRRLFDQVENIRSYGVASMEILNIAAGRLDAYLSLELSPWDYAAAGLILQEAGGMITDLEGRPLTLSGKHSVLAASVAIYPEVLHLVQCPEKESEF